MSFLWRSSLWFFHGYSLYTLDGYKKNETSFTDPMDSDLSGLSVLITGANSGLGFSAAKMLAKRNATVYLLCRNEERGQVARKQIIDETGNPNIHLEICDISDMEEIRKFTSKWKESRRPLQVLVNNAGVMLETRSTISTRGEQNVKTNFLGASDSVQVEKTFATNVLGTFLLTNELLPVLYENRPSRVIIVSSGGALTQRLDVSDFNFEKKKYDGTTAYAQTKRAQIMLNEIWAEKYRSNGINFYCMHPGWADTPGVQSSMPGFYEKMRDKLRTSDQGADTIAWLCSSKECSQESGYFYLDRTHENPHLTGCWTQSSKEDYKTLWDTCVRLSGSTIPSFVE